MDCKDDNGKNMRDFRPIFYCKDVIGLLEFVSQRRGYHAQTDLMELFRCDKGGKILPFLKSLVNLKKLVSESSSPHHRRIKRSSYKDGAFPQSLLDSGVNRSIIISLAPYALETYFNMYQMTKLLNFSYTSLKNPFDTNNLLYSPFFCGVGTARSTYPCHICIMPAKDFGKIEDEMMLKGGELRTLKSIHENAMKYQAEAKKHKGKTKISSAKYYNWENSPLYHYHGVDINTKVLNLMLPPELHLLTSLTF